jgi:hypothetical protein
VCISLIARKDPLKNSIINTFNTVPFIIGNRLALAEKGLEDPILKTIQTHTLSLHRSNLKLHFPKLSTYSAALGMSAFAVENFNKDEVVTP